MYEELIAHATTAVFTNTKSPISPASARASSCSPPSGEKVRGRWGHSDSDAQLSLTSIPHIPLHTSHSVPLRLPAQRELLARRFFLRPWARARPVMCAACGRKNWSNTQLYCEQLEKGKRAIESSEELPPLRPRRRNRRVRPAHERRLAVRAISRKSPAGTCAANGPTKSSNWWRAAGLNRRAQFSTHSHRPSFRRCRRRTVPPLIFNHQDTKALRSEGDDLKKPIGHPLTEVPM